MRPIQLCVCRCAAAPLFLRLRGVCRPAAFFCTELGPLKNSPATNYQQRYLSTANERHQRHQSTTIHQRPPLTWKSGRRRMDAAVILILSVLLFCVCEEASDTSQQQTVSANQPSNDHPLPIATTDKRQASTVSKPTIEGSQRCNRHCRLERPKRHQSGVCQSHRLIAVPCVPSPTSIVTTGKYERDPTTTSAPNAQTPPCADRSSPMLILFR